MLHICVKFDGSILKKSGQMARDSCQSEALKYSGIGYSIDTITFRYITEMLAMYTSFHYVTLNAISYLFCEHYIVNM